MEQVKNILTKLKLRLNKTKTRIVNVNREHFEFLGFKLKRTFGRLHTTPRRDAIKKFKNTVRRITCRDQPMKPKLIAGKLNSVIRGWGNYFKIGDVTKIFKRLDCWIRTRMRTFIEKKKSHYANIRITNYVLKSKYKLASLMTLI